VPCAVRDPGHAGTEPIDDKAPRARLKDARRIRQCELRLHAGEPVLGNLSFVAEPSKVISAWSALAAASRPCSTPHPGFYGAEGRITID
jgi:hypothetical protein